jgi:hypothetical protein
MQVRGDSTANVETNDPRLPALRRLATRLDELVPNIFSL